MNTRQVVIAGLSAGATFAAAVILMAALGVVIGLPELLAVALIVLAGTAVTSAVIRGRQERHKSTE